MEVPLPNLSRALLAAACLAALSGCGADRGKQDHSAKSSHDDVVLTPEAVAQAREKDLRATIDRSFAQHPKEDPAAVDDAPSPGAPSDSQVRDELRQARKALASFRSSLDTTAFLPTGPRARVLGDGTAMAPDGAPEVVKRVILAANAIAKVPYKWGGGHGAWRDNGYDCSGSVSFALAGAGLLNRPLTSGLFMRYGDSGPGKWITIYANDGHVFMFVAGLRFDTSGQGRAGTRWQQAPRGVTGFAVRHIPGL